jgi:hypothetical protein
MRVVRPGGGGDVAMSLTLPLAAAALVTLLWWCRVVDIDDLTPYRCPRHLKESIGDMNKR